MTPDKALESLRSRFDYKEDGKDLWHILPGTGRVKGDCEDFALTLIKEVTGRFWWPLIRGRFELYHCFHRDVGHMVLYDAKTGLYADNIQPRWFTGRWAYANHYDSMNKKGLITISIRLFRGLWG